MSRRRASILALLLLILLAPLPVWATVDGYQGRQPAQPPQETVHIVRRGETLFSIAERYGLTVDALAHANDLHDPAKLYVGQRLSIPVGNAEIDPQATMTYVVQPGDSLVGIARRHTTSWQSLARLNTMVSPNVLLPGQVIRVPFVDHSKGQIGGLHVVGDGETLFRIALRYEVLPWSLVEASDLAHPVLIHPGQMLLVPADELSRLPAPFQSVAVQPLPVSQGESLVVAVRTRERVTLSGDLFERRIRFAEENDVYYGLAGVHVFTEPGAYEMTLRAQDSDGRVTEVTVDVIVEAEQYGYERIPASPSLLDPAVVAVERERLDALRPTFSQERSWSGVFERPCGGTVSSYFGSRRAYNQGPYTSYHGGVDFRGGTGTPVYAPVAGTVVLTDQLAVRGNALMLDHGWGILTGYWHLSAIEVEVGQRVEQGDLIARIGNTGLSTGSHLHWEMWVGGVNVNPLQWLDPFYAWPEGEETPGQGNVQ